MLEMPILVPSCHTAVLVVAGGVLVLSEPVDKGCCPM